MNTMISASIIRRAGVFIAAASAAVAPLGSAPAGASASACAAWTGVQPPNPGTSFNELNGVAVLSSCNAWAVGSYGSGSGSGSGADQTLILHWNGTAWRRVVLPSPDPDNPGRSLTGVAVISPRNAWAVGLSFASDTGPSQTLILHWNGTAWKRVKSPNRRGENFLQGVAATSTRNAWAVGSSLNGTAYQTLIEHWNGTAWRLVASPNLSSTGNGLTGVAASSARNAWAVGAYDSGTGRQTFALHCC